MCFYHAQDDGDDFLPAVEFASINTNHDDTSHTPGGQIIMTKVSICLIQWTVIWAKISQQ